MQKSIQSIIIYFIVVFFLLIASSSAAGFLKVKGKTIVDGSGQEFYLKGIGLGGWLVQEGYMLHTASFANAQWQIRQKITELIGEANTEVFYETYRKNFIRKIDIDSIKAWGFNSIRLPFHWNLFAINTNPPQFINKGFEIIDSVLAWCEANQIYLILDMHAAPGGQSDENISDYNPAFPSLWQSEQNKDLTVKIWRKIAERYKDKEWIGGYDLLNEPKWHLPPNNQPLRDLYIRITDTIRLVDTNHIIFIEGNWYATDFTGLTPPWDNNMVYSFHKYWNSNDQGSIQYLIDIRNQFNVPLWLGETGENSNKWFVDCVELMRRNNIGWAWWTWKKIETTSSPLSSIMHPFYRTLLNYWNGSGPRPSASYAFTALMLQAEYLKFELCEFRKDVIDALMRQPNNTQTIPYNENLIPGIVYATEYDMGKLNFAYYDVDFQNVGGGIWNTGGKFRNDGVDIEQCLDLSSNGYNVGWIQNGEWLRYTCKITKSGLYKIKINVAAMNSGGQILLRLGGVVLGGLINVPVTNGWQNWQLIELNNIYLPLGIHQLEARFFSGGFNVSHFEFELISTNVEKEDLIPKDFELKQNYPNPFNSKTIISFSIPEQSNVKLKVYDLLGNETFTILEEVKLPGVYVTEFDAGTLSSGTYFLRLETNKKHLIRKMVILK